MNLRQKVRAHLVREARLRARERARSLNLRPVEMAAELARAGNCIDDSDIDDALARAEKKAELCEFIVRRFGDEFPADLIKEIADRGRWNREVADEAAQERKRGAA
jgi:hypothetical protein